MKKHFLYFLITVFVVAGFLATATQVSANPGGVKPTQKPSQSEKHTNNSQASNHGNQNSNQNGNKSGDTNGNKQNNSQSDSKIKRVQNFIGTVSAVPGAPAATGGETAPAAAAPVEAAANLSVILRSGATVNFVVDASTIVKIPGMKNATIADIKVGDAVVVHALVDAQGVMTARMINLVPGKPMHFHYVGEVTAYTAPTADAPGTITIKDKNGVSTTFVVTMGTKFIPPELAASLGVGVWVTIVSGPAKDGVQTAESIVIFQSGSEGEVVTYTAAAAGTPGSITIKDMGGVEHTFAVTTTTGITPAALAPNLTAGVWVAVVSSPTPMGGAQTALTIAISTASFTGEVTAVTPAAVGVPGSLTLKDSGGVSTDFILAEKTSVLPATWADKLVVGDLVTVVSSLSKLSNKQTALTVTINTVQYKGTVTAYTAATASTPGSITIQAGTVSTVFTTIMATAILPAGSTPAVGNLVLVVPDLVTVTTPLTATSINILPPTP